MDEPVAVTKLLLRKGSGRTTRLTVELGRPFQAEGGEWACQTVIAPEFDTMTIRGEDSFQALSLALRHVGQLLSGLADQGYEILEPNSGLKFPLEAYLYLPTPYGEFRSESLERPHVARRILGRWLISEVWDELGHAQGCAGIIKFQDNDSGRLEVESLVANLDYRWVSPLSDFTVRFTWESAREDSWRLGRGRASLVLDHSLGLPGDSLTGRLFVYGGPELAFTARRS